MVVVQVQGAPAATLICPSRYPIAVAPGRPLQTLYMCPHHGAHEPIMASVRTGYRWTIRWTFRAL